MAIRKVSKKSGRNKKSRNDATEHVDDETYSPQDLDILYCAIDHERDSLEKAEAILKCLIISLLNRADSIEGPLDGPYYPDVAEIACQLVGKAIKGLDCVALGDSVLQGRGG